MLDNILVICRRHDKSGDHSVFGCSQTQQWSRTELAWCFMLVISSIKSIYLHKYLNVFPNNFYTVFLNTVSK